MLNETPRLARLTIISGGQTGVDRAALDVAQELQIDCQGWCPRGRLAEDGVIDPKYPLQETVSAEYQVRTRMNVADSDATLILSRGPLTGGTALTRDFAGELGRPCLVIDLEAGDRNEQLEQIRDWLRRMELGRLNVAGPRESTSPGIYRLAHDLLRELFAAWDGRD